MRQNLPDYKHYLRNNYTLLELGFKNDEYNYSNGFVKVGDPVNTNSINTTKYYKYIKAGLNSFIYTVYNPSISINIGTHISLKLNNNLLELMVPIEYNIKNLLENNLKKYRFFEIVKNSLRILLEIKHSLISTEDNNNILYLKSFNRVENDLDFIMHFLK